MADEDPIETGLFQRKFAFSYVRKEDIPKAIEHAKAYLFSAWVPLGYSDSMQDDWARILTDMLESSVGTSFLVTDVDTGQVGTITSEMFQMRLRDLG